MFICKIKSILTALTMVLLVPCASAQFSKDELKEMIALCNSFTYLELFNSDNEIIPAGYKKKYTSPPLGMDNMFQVYVKDTFAVINIRGSTAKKTSWMENLYSVMIPSSGKITISGDDFNYRFAEDTSAYVHAGYALAIGFLHKEVIAQIRQLNKAGIYRITLTGHSQGGALANLLRAYLENINGKMISPRNVFRTYAFAAPMTGNRKFAEEYDRRYAMNNSSFNCVNSADPICMLPLTYSDTLSALEFTRLLINKDNSGMRRFLVDGALQFLDPAISDRVLLFGTAASRELSRDLGNIVMPEYRKEINYQRVKNRIELGPFEVPKFLRDSSILKTSETDERYQRGEDGEFLDKSLYYRPSWTFQHKPYNYYVSILRTYFPEEYSNLKKKYLLD